MNPFQGMGSLTKNPLGILAIFLGVLYGIAGLLLASRQGRLLPLNETLITLLIVVFPLFALGVFAWLVAKHHTKLYAPSDFRADSSFLGVIVPQTQAERSEKIANDIAAAQLEVLAPDLSSDTGGVSEKIEQGQEITIHKNLNLMASASERKGRIIALERAALDRIERDWGLKLERDVALSTENNRRLTFDAIQYVGRELKAIEVFVTSNVKNISARLRDISAQMLAIRREVLARGREFTPIIIVVVDAKGLDAGIREIARGRAIATFRDVGVDNLRIEFIDASELEYLEQ